MSVARNENETVAGAGGERRWTLHWVGDFSSNVRSNAIVDGPPIKGGDRVVEVVEVAALEQAREGLRQAYKNMQWAGREAHSDRLSRKQLSEALFTDAKTISEALASGAVQGGQDV